MLNMDDFALWQQARTAHPHNDADPNPPFMAALEQFAAAIRVAERERFAKNAALKLDRVESAISYTIATVGPGCQRKQDGEWVEVHRGRARSSERQLSAALEDLQEIRRTLLDA